MDILNLYSELAEPYQKLINRINDLRQGRLDKMLESAWFEQDMPSELPRILGDEGLLGADVILPSGRRVHDAWEYGLIMRGIEACDSGFRSFISVQSALATYAIAKYGSPVQHQRFLDALLDGRSIASFALTEPQGGSDPGAMQTTATKTERGWSLSGTKRWVTNAGFADVIVLWARTKDGVRGFLLEPSKGMSLRKITGKLSLQASASYELSIDQCEVSNDALLPNAMGLGAALDCLNQARYGICWGVLGAAESCIDITLRYIQDRTLFGRSLASFQLAQSKIVDCSQMLTQAQLTAFRLAELRMKDKLTPTQISYAKMNNVEAALKIARICRELLGANGVLLENKVMRHMNNLETVYTYEGTHDIHKLVVGQSITGQAAFK